MGCADVCCVCCVCVRGVRGKTLLKSGWNGQSVRRDVLEQEKCCLRTGKVARVGNRRVVCETGRICLKRGKVLPEKWIACDLNKN